MSAKTSAPPGIQWFALHTLSGQEPKVKAYIEKFKAAEELGADGAYFRVHHFARQLGSPFPLLAAVGARTKKIV